MTTRPHQSTRTPEHQDTSTPEHQDTSTPEHQDTRTPEHQHTSTPATQSKASSLHPTSGHEALNESPKLLFSNLRAEGRVWLSAAGYDCSAGEKGFVENSRRQSNKTVHKNPQMKQPQKDI